MNHPWLTTIDWPEETSDLLRLSTPQGSIAYVSVVCQPGTDKSGIVFSCNWQVELAGATMGKFWLELKCAVRRRILEGGPFRKSHYWRRHRACYIVKPVPASPGECQYPADA